MAVIKTESQKQRPEVFCERKVFLEISQNLQENTCARVSFLIKLQACKFIKKETGTGVFLLILMVAYYFDQVTYVCKEHNNF